LNRAQQRLVTAVDPETDMTSADATGMFWLFLLLVELSKENLLADVQALII